MRPRRSGRFPAPPPRERRGGIVRRATSCYNEMLEIYGRPRACKGGNGHAAGTAEPSARRKAAEKARSVGSQLRRQPPYGYCRTAPSALPGPCPRGRTTARQGAQERAAAGARFRRRHQASRTPVAEAHAAASAHGVRSSVPVQRRFADALRRRLFPRPSGVRAAARRLPRGRHRRGGRGGRARFFPFTVNSLSAARRKRK